MHALGTPQYVDTDVLVIGGGLAGCRAALRARDFCEKVTLVDKGVVSRSGTTLWCHEILAPVPEKESLSWMKEMVEYTEFFSDQECIEILFREGTQRLKELEEWGVPFTKNGKGEYVQEPVRGMIDPCKAVFYQGRLWMDAVKRQMLQRGIKIVNRLTITDLLTSDGKHPTQGRILGAVGFDGLTGEFRAFKTKAVVVTTGMSAGKMPKERMESNTGDGQGMAYRAGAELTGMEFGPGGGYYALKNKRMAATKGFVQFQNHGAHVTNGQGERIMAKYEPDRMERASGRGPLAQAFIKEFLEGRGPLYFDMRHWDDERIRLMRTIIPLTMARLDNAGINLQRDRIEFTVISSGFYGSGEGGIKVGINGETNLTGLFAAGAASNIRAHVEAFGSATQANCNVFGYRAGEAAGKAAAKMAAADIDPGQITQLRQVAVRPLEGGDGLSPEDLFSQVNKWILPWKYSIFKHERRINESLAEIERIEESQLPLVRAKDAHDLVKANEVRNYILVSRLYLLSALERKESRCKHYREDYPYRDDIDWLKWIILRREGDGIKISTEPIPVETYPVKLGSRKRIPAPVQFSYEDYEKRAGSGGS